MNEFAYGGLIGICTILVVIFWLNRIDRGLRNTSPSSDGVLPVAPSYKRYTFAISTMVVAAAYTVFKHQQTDMLVQGVFYITVLGTALLAVHMLWDMFAPPAKLTTEGIQGVDRFHNSQTVAWHEITSIKFDTNFNVITIKAANRHIRICQYCEGIYPALEQIEQHAPKFATQSVTEFLERTRTE